MRPNELRVPLMNARACQSSATLHVGKFPVAMRIICHRYDYAARGSPRRATRGSWIFASYTRAHAGDDAFAIAEAHASRGELDEAFRWLDRAYAQKDPGLYLIKGDLLLKNLEPDSRYKAFPHKMKLL